MAAATGEAPLEEGRPQKRARVYASGRMEIYVENITGRRTYTLSAKASDTIDDIKGELADMINDKPERMDLFKRRGRGRGNWKLKNDRTLRHYKITPRSRLWVMMLPAVVNQRKVIVSMMNGDEFTIEANDYDTVMDLKIRIEIQQRYHVHTQHLVCGDKVLKNGDKLKGCGCKFEFKENGDMLKVKACGREFECKDGYWEPVPFIRLQLVLVLQE